MDDDNKTFTYMYSAKQQEEVKSILQKYIPKEEDKMEQLRRLDKRAESCGTFISILVGTVGVLVLGFGMSCMMVWEDTLMLPGIVFGVIGIVGIALAYPLFISITKKHREKLVPEIMRLSQELMGEN